MYVFCVQDSNNCLQCDSVIITEPNALQTFDDAELQMTIYPNPFSDYATIRISGSERKDFTISFFDVAGRKVYMQVEKLNSTNDKMHYRIYNHNLSPGIYFIKVFADGEAKGVGKFIIR